MRSVLLCVLLLQVPSGAPAADTGATGHERRREAIESMNSGVELFASGDIEAAEQALTRARELDPRESHVHVNLGRFYAYAERGRSDEAVAAYTRAIELIEASQDQPESSPHGLDASALASLRAEVHFDLGRLYLGQAQARDILWAERGPLAAQAVAALTTATAPSPADYRAHHLLGVAHDLLDDAVTADRSYRACIELQPHYVPCYADLAQLYLDFGAPEHAQSVVEVATKLNEGDAEAWLVAARLHLSREHHEQAVAAGKKAQALEPHSAEINFVLGMSYAELHMREEAIEQLQLYMQRQIGDPSHRVRVATDRLMVLMEPGDDTPTLDRGYLPSRPQ